MAALENCSTCKNMRLDSGNTPRCHRHPPITFSPTEKMPSIVGVSSYVWPSVELEGWCNFWCDEKYTNIVGAGTFTLLSSPGKLFRIVLNKNTGTSITVYDSPGASGVKVATLSTIAQASFEYDLSLQNGLTIVTVGPIDITVIYQ